LISVEVSSYDVGMELLPVAQAALDGRRWWRPQMSDRWWVRMVMWGLAGAAVVAAAEAIVAAVAVPHLIRLDVAVDDALVQASTFPDLSDHVTSWPSVARTAWLSGASAAGLAVLAVVVHLKRRSPRIVLFAAQLAMPALIITRLDPLPTPKDVRMTIGTAHRLGADRYQDANYVWYVDAAFGLTLALAALLCVAVLAGWAQSSRQERPSADQAATPAT
jgi:hypothetical protein